MTYKTRRKRKIREHQRLILLIRDRQHCRYCGVEVDPFGDDVYWRRQVFDHVIPVMRGGTMNVNNMVTVCRQCDSRKGCRTPEEAGMKLLPAPGRLLLCKDFRFVPKTLDT